MTFLVRNIIDPSENARKRIYNYINKLEYYSFINLFNLIKRENLTLFLINRISKDKINKNFYKLLFEQALLLIKIKRTIKFIKLSSTFKDINNFLIYITPKKIYLT